VVDFGLNEEHVALRESVRAFATDVVAPQISGLYEKGSFPVDIVRQLGRMGLFGLPFPEDVGGMGGDLTALGVAIEELARVDSSVAITLEAGVSLGAMPIYRFGSAELKDRWLPRLVSGEILGAFGLTEAGGGTDAGATRTTARLNDDGTTWTIDGTKAFITNSGTELTGFVIVTAVTGTRTDGGREISSILVPSGTPGFTVGPSYDKVGWRCSDTHELAFDGCQVPVGNLVGERGRGFAQFLEILDGGRVAIAALSTGLAQGCVDESTRYALLREAFGRPIGANQAVAFQVADMDVRAHTSRLAWWHAAALADAGLPFRREAAIAKLVASEAAMDNARWATQVHGGYGFTNESAVGRFYRDAKVLEIGEGTSEVQRMLIARDLGLPV
jgi:short/branched chain acyl-CoA dehydrogenase